MNYFKWNFIKKSLITLLSLFRANYFYCTDPTKEKTMLRIFLLVLATLMEGAFGSCSDEAMKLEIDLQDNMKNLVATYIKNNMNKQSKAQGEIELTVDSNLKLKSYCRSYQLDNYFTLYVPLAIDHWVYNLKDKDQNSLLHQLKFWNFKELSLQNNQKGFVFYAKESSHKKLFILLKQN
jgi:hypothetical protein